MIWNFLTWLEQTDFSSWLREGDFVAQPFSAFYVLLGVHSIGMAIVVGVSMMLSSRLFGFQQAISIPRANQLMTLAWWGFYINLASGILLYIAQPRRELLTVVYWIKMAVIVLAVITMRVIQTALDNIEYEPAPDGSGTAVEVVPLKLRAAALMLDLCWVSAIIAGRLIGYMQPPPPPP
jgi:hypothetical protein